MLSHAGQGIVAGLARQQYNTAEPRYSYPYRSAGAETCWPAWHNTDQLRQYFAEHEVQAGMASVGG